jgi:site-specific DNA recombinase
LASLNIKEEVLELYYEVMTDIFSSDDTKMKVEVDSIEKRIAEVEELVQNAQDKFMGNSIDEKDYQGIKRRYSEKLNDLRAQKEHLSTLDINMVKYMKYSFGLIQNLPQHYQEAAFDLKQKIVGSVFPEKLIFDGKTYRTASANSLIGLLFNDSNGLRVSKNKKAEKKSRLPLKGSPSRARTSDPIINSHVL